MTKSNRPRRRPFARLRERLGAVDWRRGLLDFVLITVGSLLLALAYNLFLIPNNVVSGGLSGLAIILRHYFNTPVGLVTIALNVPLFLAGLRWGGGMTTGLRTVYAVLLFSLAMDWLAPYVPPATDSPLLYVTYGGLLSGVGVGLVFSAQGTLGGGGIVARILRHFMGVSVSRAMFLVDAIVIGGAALVFGLERAMYGAMVAAIGTWAVDVVLSGGRRSRQALVISDHWQSVRDVLLGEMERGVTILRGEGGYTGRERTLLMCIVNASEIARLRRLVQTVDSAAFVVVMPTTEVWGTGFGAIAGDT